MSTNTPSQQRVHRQSGFTKNALPIIGALGLFLLASIALASEPCCNVTNVSADGKITAQEKNGSRTFQFQVTDRIRLRALKVGSPVYANFDTGLVSLDGTKSCCKILPVSSAVMPAVEKSTPVAPATTRTPAPRPAAPSEEPAVSRTTEQPQNPLSANTRRANSRLPTLSFGTLQDARATKWSDGAQGLVQFQNRKMMQLNGVDDIKKATSLPQAARDVLWLHARTLEAQEQDSYIIIPEEAQKWSGTLPESVRKELRKAAEDDGKKKKKGCSTKHISMGCVKNEVDQAVDDVTKTARKAWDDIEAEWGRLIDNLEDAQKCFADKTLRARVPVKFFVEPIVPVTFSRSASSSNKAGAASGNVQGTVVVNIPVTVDSTVELSVFYIPCVPFAVRPRSIGAEGKLDAGANLFANVTASGEFSQFFTIPPAGGIQIPYAVLPIVLGGVPIAVLDVSLYLDGTLRVDGRGTLNGNLLLESMQKTEFDFSCSGHGCGLEKKNVPVPATAVETVQVDGRIRVKPAIYTALQLGLNYRMLNVRAGPQPYLLGQIHGCGAAVAAQDTAGASSSQNWYALGADLDWGLELRAEALAGGAPVAEKIWKLREEHIYFKDLVNSTAFIPAITSMSQPKPAQPAAFTMKMPNCYLYPDAMKYQVRWTGGATANTSAAGSATPVRNSQPLRTAGAPAASTCTVAAGQASCQGAPMNDTLINLAWPAAGNFTLTVTPQVDAHGRRFDASRAAELSVDVQP